MSAEGLAVGGEGTKVEYPGTVGFPWLGPLPARVIGVRRPVSSPRRWRREMGRDIGDLGFGIWKFGLSWRLVIVAGGQWSGLRW